MFLNCKFIGCYITSMFDYLLGTQKTQISWNDPNAVDNLVLQTLLLVVSDSDRKLC